MNKERREKLRSRHRKQRKWKAERDAEIKQIEMKGVTVGAVHPSENQTLNPTPEEKGATARKLPYLHP